MLYKLILIFMITGSIHLQSTSCLIAFCETCAFIQTSADGFKNVKSCFKCAPYYKLADYVEETNKVEEVQESPISSE
jgi:hypothetical protein